MTKNNKTFFEKKLKKVCIFKKKFLSLHKKLKNNLKMKTIILTVSNLQDLKNLIGRLVDANFFEFETSHNDMLGYIIRIRDHSGANADIINQLAHETQSAFAELR